VVEQIILVKNKDERTMVLLLHCNDIKGDKGGA
jgi:hypothetical protein